MLRKKNIIGARIIILIYEFILHWNYGEKHLGFSYCLFYLSKNETLYEKSNASMMNMILIIFILLKKFKCTTTWMLELSFRVIPVCPEFVLCLLWIFGYHVYNINFKGPGNPTGCLLSKIFLNELLVVFE